MTEYADFVRARSEEDSDDIEMLDAAPSRRRGTSFPETSYQNGTVRVDDDVDMAQSPQDEPHPSIEQDSAQPRSPEFVIAIDFGTTFSSVAFVRLESNARADLITPEAIKCIDHFPDVPGLSADVAKSYQTVPTELLCYTQKGKKDHSDIVSSDSDSKRSLELDWESSSSGDSDQEREQHTTSPSVRNDRTRDSIWGWGVHTRLEKSESIPQELIHLTNFKLQLDAGNSARDLRSKSARDLTALKPAKVVDIISEYLGQLLKHTKARLTEFHGLRYDSSVEFVLCVPTSWSDRACRIMQDALTMAIKTSQLVMLKQGMIEDLFIVAESEAAAIYAMEDRKSLSKMTTGDSFLLLDCGGGTVDAVTYKLTRDDPVRMEEVVDPEGVSCGSSFLNENYRKLLQDRLKHAEFVADALPLESNIANAVQVFERAKRSINIVDKKAHIDAALIYGLKAAEDRELRFRRNNLGLSWDEMYGVFKDCLRGVSDLMLKQLNAAKAKGYSVERVILTGGFGDSPSLRNHLKKILRKERNLLNRSIDLETSYYVQSAVSRGAVLRALRKEFGPPRHTRSSYGVLRSELFDINNPIHKRLSVHRDRADGELYIMDTIEWVIEKVHGRNLRPKWFPLFSLTAGG
jgi:molecular chaperone DnaK (HSP70)